jgi:hypothetical protein
VSPLSSRCWQRKHLRVVVVVVRPSLSPLVGQRCQQRRPRQQRWLSRRYPRPEERGQHDPIAWRKKNKNKNSATTAARIACAMITTPRCSFCCGTGNARVFALRCCCCRLVVFVSTRGRCNQQPTKPWRKEEEDLMSWLTPAFLVLPKTKTRKKLESLPWVGSQSHLMSFSEIEIFSSMTFVMMRILMRLYETKSHEISLMTSHYY